MLLEVVIINLVSVLQNLRCRIKENFVVLIIIIMLLIIMNYCSLSAWRHVLKNSEIVATNLISIIQYMYIHKIAKLCYREFLKCNFKIYILICLMMLNFVFIEWIFFNVLVASFFSLIFLINKFTSSMYFNTELITL